MTREQNYWIIWEACNKANPDRMFFKDGRKKAGERLMRLSDVLLAIASNRVRLTTFVASEAWFEVYEQSNVHTHEQAWKATGAKWNLRKDDLIQQSAETLSFLAELLS